MPSTTTDRLNGLTTSVAVKPPCIAVATTNVTLAGLQVIGGVQLQAGDRVLPIAQTNPIENGIYIADSGDWTRAKDFDGDRDAVQGTLVLVRNQFTEGAFYEVTSANPIIFGSSAITFRLRDAPNITYDLTQLEVNAGVTPSVYSFEPYYVDRYGALGNNVQNDAPATSTAESIGARQVDFRRGSIYKFVPTSSSPFYFGNITTSLVYAGVMVDGSNQMFYGPGAELHVTSRPGVISADFQYCLTSLKSLAQGTQTNLTYWGLSHDTNNDGDAANSNHRFVYNTGVVGVRFINTRGHSTGARRGTFANIQNCKNVQVIGHYHKKNTQCINFRYTQNMVVVGGIFDDFSECLDFDGTQRSAVVLGNAFESTSRANQMWDINGQVDGVYMGATVFNLGQIAQISHKFTTQDNFSDYVNNVAATVRTPSQRIVVSGIAGQQIGSTSSVSVNLSNDWSDGGHNGFKGTHEVILNNILLEDTSYWMIWEAENLTIRDVYLGAVLTAASTYAVDTRSLVGSGDQRSWSTLTGLIDGLTINSAQRGGLRCQNAKWMNIRNVSVHDINTSGGSDFAVQLNGLIERGAQITVDGLNITSGNVNINGNSASIAAWAGTTLYRRSQVVSNGGRYYRALSDSGTSAGVGGPTGIGTAIVDGTVTWEYISEPFSIHWGWHNRLAAGCSIAFSGDAHKFTHGEQVSCDIGDLVAAGTFIRPIYIARRRCYMNFAMAVVGATIAADAVNFRNIIIKSVTNLGATTTTISNFSTAAGLTAFVPFDLGFAFTEPGAQLEPGDVVYAEITATAAGKALTGLMIQPSVMGL